ncbi:glycosyltransferase family 2 protein [Anaerorhabdus furcosa]|uniref:Glycosyl transferase family 2 n=1 Tax=Anaerorhabdus furcosa TaxID=118967 RepID=A0A1T4ND90_9FIRM|nr:glycosyltransferase [Anaerorhabdus furcosa]SJZ77222.1 Glycosyl transferase family 2 [Anaerorhabdus furcosa]
MECIQKRNNYISVIVPMYNVEKYLEECVDSIEKQTYKNIEVILVDDGSEDSTFEVAKCLAKKYKNIVLLQQENGGQAKARNTGLIKASGQYISFVDADDFIDSRMFEIMIQACEKHNLDIMECCYQDVFMKKKVFGNKYFLRIDEQKIYDGKEFFEFKPSLSPCDKLYKHSYMKKINFKCTEGHYAEDAYDSSYAILSAKRIMHSNTIVYFYRRDNLGSTRNNQDIIRRVKLGEDKIYIANKLEELRKDMEIHGGYLSNIIVRNILGTILCPFCLKSKYYRGKIRKYFIQYKVNRLIRNNLSFSIIFDLTLVGIRKLITKGD